MNSWKLITISILIHIISAYCLFLLWQNSNRPDGSLLSGFEMVLVSSSLETTSPQEINRIEKLSKLKGVPTQYVEPQGLAAKYFDRPSYLNPLKSRYVKSNPQTGEAQPGVTNSSGGSNFMELLETTPRFTLRQLGQRMQMSEIQFTLPREIDSKMAISPSLREKVRRRIENQITYIQGKPILARTVIWKEHEKIYRAYSIHGKQKQ